MTSAVNPDPGGLTITIDDRLTSVAVTGGATFSLPIGPLELLDGPLEHADPPPPANLTNAFGLVHDHLDDLIIQAPSITSTRSVMFVGAHAATMARVELGRGDVPVDYELTRVAADEVFRTVALERRHDRQHNPGLPDEHLDSIIGTCCVILGFMRRLELKSVRIGAGDTG